jgi:hypothetical protein
MNVTSKQDTSSATRHQIDQQVQKHASTERAPTLSIPEWMGQLPCKHDGSR